MRASSYRLLDVANSTTIEGFLQHSRRPIKKKLRNRGGFQAAFPLYHMNRHKQQTRRKNQTEANLKKEMKGSYQMKKMKKACAVLLAVLSVSAGFADLRRFHFHCSILSDHNFSWSP
jgi:hypothetical protein